MLQWGWLRGSETKADWVYKWYYSRIICPIIWWVWWVWGEDGRIVEQGITGLGRRRQYQRITNQASQNQARETAIISQWHGISCT